jgi:hypothetical protein
LLGRAGVETVDFDNPRVPAVNFSWEKLWLAVSHEETDFGEALPFLEDP